MRPANLLAAIAACIGSVAAVDQAAAQTDPVAVMKDPEFLAETAKLNIEVDPVAGETMQKIVAGVLATPRAVAERAKPLLE